MDDASVDGDLRVVDFRRGLSLEQKEKLILVDTVSSETIATARDAFREATRDVAGGALEVNSTPAFCTIYEHKDFDGKLSRQ